MSDIPSKLSTWEPSRRIKVGFLVFAALLVVALFTKKFWDATVTYRQRIELAMRAETRSGPAPDFTVTDLAGKPVKLSDFRGKAVFVNFWASWCTPCRDEMPSLTQLTRSLHPDDVVFLAVSIDEDEDAMKKFLETQPEPRGYVVLRDKDSAVANAWGTFKLPESYLIDREGTLVYKFTGPRDWSGVAAVKAVERAGVRRLPRRAGS